MQTQVIPQSIFGDMARLAAAGLATGIVAAALMAASVCLMAQAHADDLVPSEVSRLMQQAGPSWVAQSAPVVCEA